MPAEALEVARAGGEPRMQVESADRAPGSLPRLARPGDEDDRPVEALDEARRDDADHALVPGLAREHVGAPVAPRFRPLPDSPDGVAEDPLLHGLPLTVELLQPRRQAPRLAGVLGEKQLQGDGWVAQAAGRVDPG